MQGASTQSVGSRNQLTQLQQLRSLVHLGGHKE